jgi:hypothetical protein
MDPKRAAFLYAGTAAAALTLSAIPAAAHHGWGWYGEQPFELTGTVESANMGGPHGTLRVRSSATEVWDVVLAPPNRNATAGLTAAAVKPGTQVTARGHKWKDAGRLEMKTERLLVGGKLYNLYPERD